MPKLQYDKIIILNGVCALIHFAVGIFCLVHGHDKKLQTAIPIWYTSSEWTSRAADGYTMNVELNGDMQLHIHLMVAFFHLTSACAHFFVFLGLYYKWNVFTTGMENGIIWWRWLEYSVTAPIMAVAVALVVGMREIYLLVAIFALQLVTITYGFLAEVLQHLLKALRKCDANYVTQYPSVLHNYPLLTHGLGFSPFVVCWAIILRFYHANLERLDKHDPDLLDKMPWWVNFIVWGTFLAFLLFPIPQFLYFSFFKEDDYWQTEFFYNILSLISKLYLGLFIITAFAAPCDDDCTNQNDSANAGAGIASSSSAGDTTTIVIEQQADDNLTALEIVTLVFAAVGFCMAIFRTTNACISLREKCKKGQI
jgi:hypothetical protein